MTLLCCPCSRKEKAEDGGWFEKDDGWDPSQVAICKYFSFPVIVQASVVDPNPHGSLKK